MTGQERDYDEVLSRVLHSTTDQIEPVGDGLTKIQARLAEPWLKRQWWLLHSEFTILSWVLAVRCQSWFSTVRYGSAAGAHAGGGAGKAVGTGVAGGGGRPRSLRPMLSSIGAWASGKRTRHPVGPAMTWLRPALGVGGAVVLVVAGVFAMNGIQSTLGTIETANSSGTAASGNAGGAGGTNGQGSRAVQIGQSSSPGALISPRASSTASSKASPSPTACSSPSVLPSTSPEPSPTSATPTPDPSPTPTPTTPSPSPSPSPSTSSGAQVGSETAGAQSGVIETTALVLCQHPGPSPTNEVTTAP